MGNKTKIILGACSVFLVFAVGLVLWLCWPAIEGTINGSRYYTEEDLQEAYDSGYNDGLANEEELTSQIEAYVILIEQNGITINDLNSQIETLTEQNQEYAEANEILNQSVLTLQNQVNDLQSDISDLEDEIISKQQQINSLQSQLSNLQDENDSNLSIIISLNTQIENLENDIVELNDLITNYTATINSLNLSIDNLNSEIEDLEESRQSLQSQVNSLTSQIDGYQQEIENYKSIIATLQRENYATVIFKIENEVVSTQSIKKGTHPTEVEDERLNDDTFKGWIIENTTDIVDPYTYNIEQNVVFVASFETTYNVTFIVEDSTVDTQSVNAGDYATEYIVSDTGEYVFDYWIVNSVKVENISTYQINADTEFIAVLKYYKTVSYQVDEEIIKTEKILEGNSLNSNFAPTIKDFEIKFNGWLLNNEFVDTSILVVTDNITLVASLTDNHSDFTGVFVGENEDGSVSLRLDITDSNVYFVTYTGSNESYIKEPAFLDEAYNEDYYILGDYGKFGFEIYFNENGTITANDDFSNTFTLTKISNHANDIQQNYIESMTKHYIASTFEGEDVICDIVFNKYTLTITTSVVTAVYNYVIDDNGNICVTGGIMGDSVQTGILTDTYLMLNGLTYTFV